MEATIIDYAFFGTAVFALLLTIMHMYLQHFRDGKLVCRIQGVCTVDVNLEEDTFTYKIIVIFENNQKKDWIITSLFYNYIFLNIITKCYYQIHLKNHFLQVPTKQTLARCYEIKFPLNNFEYCVNPQPPKQSKSESNSIVMRPFIEILPQWTPFYKDKFSYSKFQKYIEEKCPKDDLLMCHEFIEKELRAKSERQKGILNKQNAKNSENYINRVITQLKLYMKSKPKP